MFPKLWLKIMFLMSRIGELYATGQCYKGERSVGRMFPRGNTLKTYRVGLPEECYFRRKEEVTCQSFNFVIGQNICEQNNSPKEARPEDFNPDQRRFYMQRFGNRGTPWPTHMRFGLVQRPDFCFSSHRVGAARKELSAALGSFLFTFVSGNKTQERLTTRVLKS